MATVVFITCFLSQVRAGGSCQGGAPGGSCLDSNLQHLLLLNSLLPASSPPSPTSQYSLFTSWGCPNYSSIQATGHWYSNKVRVLMRCAGILPKITMVSNIFTFVLWLFYSIVVESGRQLDHLIFYEYLIWFPVWWSSQCLEFIVGSDVWSWVTS